MEIHFDIPDWVKIPMKILLPGLWLFSGIILFSPDHLLEKIGVLTWKQENIFYFGLCFLIVSCLILIYVLYFIGHALYKLLLNITINRRTMKKILKLSQAESDLIFFLYTQPEYTAQLDYGNPIVAGLLQRGFLYTARTQVVSLGYGNALKISCTLQPIILQALDHYRNKEQKEIQKLEAKLKTAKPNKKAKIEQELAEYENFKQQFMQEDN